MQLQSPLTLLLTLSLTTLSLATPQITATPAATASASIAAALQNLEFDLALGGLAEVSKVTNAIATAPEAVRTAVEAALPNQATEDYAAFASAVNNIVTGTPSGFGALPTDVQSFVKSVAGQEASIFNNNGQSVAPTATTGAAERVGVKGMGVAAVGLGVAGLVLL